MIRIETGLYSKRRSRAGEGRDGALLEYVRGCLHDLGVILESIFCLRPNILCVIVQNRGFGGRRGCVFCRQAIIANGKLVLSQSNQSCPAYRLGCCMSRSIMLRTRVPGCGRPMRCKRSNKEINSIEAE